MAIKNATVENKIAKELEKLFGQPFIKITKDNTKIQASNGKDINHKLDLVSKDNKIIVEVKNYKFGNRTTGNAGYTTTRKWRLFGACLYLDKLTKANGVKVTKKILALTNKKLCAKFKGDIDPLMNCKEIDIRFVSIK